MSGDDKTILELDKYERDNLVALLKVIRNSRVASSLNTGDWLGQIYLRLTDGKGFSEALHDPNIPPHLQIRWLDEKKA